MTALEKNVINLWGEPGKDWLERIPEIISVLSGYWRLSEISPVNNMNYNYVARAKNDREIPVVLKFSYDGALIEDEYRALMHFNGEGAVKVLDRNLDLNALLLEQAIPGESLKSNKIKNLEETIKVYTEIVVHLSSTERALSGFTHVKKWCDAIDRIHDNRIEAKFIDKAKLIRVFLLGSLENEYLCHGDLHLENIISHQNTWISIDPKGVVGEIAFEVAAFDLIEKSEWSEPELIEDKVNFRVHFLSDALKINRARLLKWIFLRVIISAQWFIEDNGDPDEMLRLASVLYPMLES